MFRGGFLPSPSLLVERGAVQGIVIGALNALVRDMPDADGHLQADAHLSCEAMFPNRIVPTSLL